MLSLFAFIEHISLHNLRKMKNIILALLLMVASTCAALAQNVSADSLAVADAVEQEAQAQGDENAKGEQIDPKAIIFEHLGDCYGWEVPFNHHKSIPLPIIVKGSKGWKVFSSSQVDHGQTFTHPDGSIFKIAGEESPNKGKVVELLDGKEVKPTDLSITKDVLAILISVGVVLWMILGLAAYHRGKGRDGKAPRGALGAVEALVMFLLDEIIRPTLKDKATKFAPYLLTVFLFIFVANILGLIVVFPGGANLTGNIAVTMVLAIITFLVTNIFATKHYWKEIFWPDVPLWLKFPLPIMPAIEIFGIFTKPAALTVRLFANMMGGHIIVIVLTLLIFIFTAIAGAAVGGATAVVSIFFSVFMLLLDVLVSFIQAFVFTMLSTLFIALAQENGHHEKHEPQPESTKN